MRGTVLPVAVAVLLAGCGLDSDPTAPDNAGLPVAGPALDVPEPQLAAAATNVWTTKAPLPAPRYYAAGAVLNGLIYVVGGSVKDTVATRTVQAYNPGSNSWATKAPLPAARWAPSAGVINGVLYVAGGTDGSFKPTNDALRLHTRDQHLDDQGADAGRGRVWRRRRDRREAVRVQPVRDRGRLPALRSGDQQLAAAGAPGLAPPAPRRRRDRWEVLSGGRAGRTAAFPRANMEVYDPATNTWTPAPSMPTGAVERHGHRDRRPPVRRGRIGRGTAASATVEVYDPAQQDLAGQARHAHAPVRPGEWDGEREALCHRGHRSRRGTASRTTRSTRPATCG